MATPPGADFQLTSTAQVLVNVSVFLVTTVAAAVAYFRRMPPPSIEAQVVGGALADRQSMERLAGAINEVASEFGRTSVYLEDIAKGIRRLTEEAERVGRTQDRVAGAIESQVRRTGG